MRLLLRCALALLMLCMLIAPSAQAEATVLTRSEAGPTLLVRMRAGLSEQDARATLAASGFEPIEYLAALDVWRATAVSASDADVSGAADALGAAALWVEPDGYAYAQEITPDDPAYASQQWSLPLIGMEEAWSLSQGSGRIIAIIDSGIDLTHLDLVAKLWTNRGEVAANGLDDDEDGLIDDVHGWDYVDGDAVPADGYGHGTHVSGIAAAATDNAIGIAGIAWRSRIMVLRTLGDDGRGSYSNIALALHYAADHGAHVINLSLGGTSPSTVMAEQVAYAQSKGSLVVAAAGNYGTQGLLYPAALDGVLAVGASTSTDQPWSGNCWGPEMDVSAPGVGIYSTLPGSQYGSMTGTSMATPHVSGIAAVIMSYAPALTAEEVAAAITGTAVDIGDAGWDAHSGWGRVDAAAALASVETAAPAHRSWLPFLWTQ